MFSSELAQAVAKAVQAVIDGIKTARTSLAHVRTNGRTAADLTAFRAPFRTDAKIPETLGFGDFHGAVGGIRTLGEILSLTRFPEAPQHRTR